MARTMSRTIESHTVEDTVVPARGPWSRRLGKGEHDHDDRYAAADTMKINASGIFLGTGTVRYGAGLTPLFATAATTSSRR